MLIKLKYDSTDVNVVIRCDAMAGGNHSVAILRVCHAGTGSSKGKVQG